MNHRNLPLPVNQGAPLRVTIMAEPPQIGEFPVLVTATPTVQAGARYDDLQSLNTIANALRIETRRRIDRYKNWTPATSNARATGVVIMENWNNEGHRAARNNITLRNLNAGLLLEMFESAQANGSNPDLRLEDVDWYQLF